jgi:hypothetical protein
MAEISERIGRLLELSFCHFKVERVGVDVLRVRFDEPLEIEQLVVEP